MTKYQRINDAMPENELRVRIQDKEWSRVTNDPKLKEWIRVTNDPKLKEDGNKLSYILGPIMAFSVLYATWMQENKTALKEESNPTTVSSNDTPESEPIIRNHQEGKMQQIQVPPAYQSTMRALLQQNLSSANEGQAEEM